MTECDLPTLFCVWQFYSEDDIRIEEVFIGYNKDTAAGVILKAWEALKPKKNDNRGEEEKDDVENSDSDDEDEDEDDAFTKVNQYTLQIVCISSHSNRP